MSVAALVLSIVSLVWSFALTWIRWPRISVEMRQSVSVGSPSKDTLNLVVLNLGAEATTIANVGIRSEDRSIGIDYEANRDPFEGPDLPARIEGHGCLVWTLSDDSLTPIPSQTKIAAYAFRYKAYRKYPKSRRTMLRITEAKYTTHRNGGILPTSE
ncbi:MULTISPECIES: hypothetical protein [unclassified Rhodococcus (in: high G+C Gram-positive bacteria)]|uniref:hypothetical protein n=1 Tax=unclassified Rhodococcus (in: high G+C Gram-positive bacteria) TaxID=192944 RepID=UPI00117A44EC|nr:MULTISPECIES: hypothetical protein [unclassified Rhodococcus (in: high G+C Gram-positive bacteria)]